MRIVITGNPDSGQRELFSIQTGIALDVISQKPMEVQKGVCDVKDPRIMKLSEMYKPKKTTYTKIEYSLLPDFNLQGPAKTLVLNELRNSDEICWVCRSEEADKDVDAFISELFINDMMLVEKRLETLEKELKKKQVESKEKERSLIQRCKQAIDENRMIRTLEFTQEENVLIRTLQFLTAKPIVVVINSEEGQDASALASGIESKFGTAAISFNAKIEEEISRLSDEDKKTFMQEFGIEEPALQKMTRVVYRSLGLISFFTVGEDEVRAWPIRAGASAQEAGGAIHSDIAKGFVRAELFKYADLLEAGSEAKLKDTGKYYLKGRDYTMEDGDIASFRFNV